MSLSCRSSLLDESIEKVGTEVPFESSTITLWLVCVRARTHAGDDDAGATGEGDAAQVDEADGRGLDRQLNRGGAVRRRSAGSPHPGRR